MSVRAGRRARQLTLDEAHTTRPSVTARAPLHVTLRIASAVPSLRRDRAVRIVRAAIAVGHREEFRIVQFSVLSNHIHLIVEAASQQALARGMQALAIRIAKRLNCGPMCPGCTS